MYTGNIVVAINTSAVNRDDATIVLRFNFKITPGVYCGFKKYIKFKHYPNPTVPKLAILVPRYPLL